MQIVLSHFLNNHVRRHTVAPGCATDVCLFKKSQNNGISQVGKTSKEVAGTFEIKLRTVK